MTCKTLPWMSEATRQQALAKLAAFTPKIGYPDKWRDYSNFSPDRGPFVTNLMRGRLFEFQCDINKIGKPLDRTKWAMTPPTVNARLVDAGGCRELQGSRRVCSATV